MSLTYSLLLWACVMLFPRLFVSLFTNDAELIAFAGRALRVYIAASGIFGIQIACQMTFLALGNAKASISVAVMRKFILLLPLIYILPGILRGNQALAVYLAEPIADFISVCFTVILFAFQFRKSIARISAPLAEAE